MKTFMCPLHIALLSALALAPFASATAAQQAFATPDEAARVLVEALSADHADEAKLRSLFGDQWRDFVPVGSVDREDVDAFLRHYKERHSFEQASPDLTRLSVGKEPWLLPIPLKKGADGWTFDLPAGVEEVRVRRIGANELAAVQAVLAYHDAQTEYAEVDRDKDSLLEYARKFVSTDGAHDGLYWAQDDSGMISPLGPLFGDDQPDGDWHGYRYRIVEGQGPSAPGGAYDYRFGDQMIRGFALIAWPVKYNDTGVMSFMISHEGQVFEKDLGPDTDKQAAATTLFDPDSSWNEVPLPQAAATP